ncbi:MAG TPA: ABC transporter substrate-binding protein, partial [Acidimicrobiales bacterium]|nr:ABC transporter substrate-binding protein [Acidimicrobiales bacterium]
NPLKGAPYNDYRFRQAVAYAIDRDQMVEQVLNGRGKVASSGGLANSSAWSATGLPTYDDDAGHTKAKDLLAAVGFANTDGDPELELNGADFNPNLYFGTVTFSQAPVDFIVQKLAAVGIKVNPVGEQQTPNSDQRAQTGNYEMVISAWAGHSADPDTLRQRLAHSVTTNPDGTVRSAAFQNVFGWNSSASGPVVDDKGAQTTRADWFNRLAGEQLVELDTEARLQKVQQMQELVAEDVPYVGLYIPDSLLYFRDRFTPWYFTPGATPHGPNTANNKQVFVTGRQFGSAVPGLGL